MDSHRFKTAKIITTEHVYQIVDTLHRGELAISPLDWSAPRGGNVHCACNFFKQLRKHSWLATEDLYQHDPNF